MPSDTAAKQLRDLIGEQLLRDHADRGGKVTLFFGVPLDQFTREELMAIVNYQMAQGKADRERHSEHVRSLLFG